MGLLKANRRDGFEPPQTDVADIVPTIDHHDPAVRRRAVQGLAGRADQVGTLVAVLQDETDNGVRQAAFIALASMNCEAAAREVATLLSDADPALRNGALETLVTMPEHALALLEPLGRDDDPDVRIFAVLLASELHHGDAGEWLIGLALAETDANVCSNLAEALGGSDARGAGEALAAIAARFPQDPYLVFAVETALQRLSED